MRQAGPIVALVIAFTSPLPAAEPAAGDAGTARWRLTAGERLRYRVTRSSVAHIRPDVAIKLTLVLEFDWAVDAVADDGTATVTAAVRRVRWDGNPAGVQRFDSAVLKDRDNPVLPLIVDRQVRFHLSPRGHVSDLALLVPPDDLPQATRDGLGDLRRDPLFPGLATAAAHLFLEPEAALRVLVAETSLPLPDGPVAPGAEPWRVPDPRAVGIRNVQVGPFEYRVAPDPGGGEPSVGTPIRVTGNVEPAGPPDGKDVPDEPLRPAEGLLEGTVHFDRSAGRLVRSHTQVTLKFPAVEDTAAPWTFDLTTDISLERETAGDRAAPNAAD